jgi:cysteine desulfurase
MKRIYLDHSSTTPVDKRVFKEMEPYFLEKYGNPSSVHFSGQEASFAVDQARQRVADFLNCRPQEVFFVGSATEANNIVVLGSQRKGHIITSKIEHDALLEPCRYLEKNNVRVSY